MYHGHNGGVNGGLTEMAYMPEYGVGYFYSINSGNGDAFSRVGKTIRAYITAKLQKPPLPPSASLPSNAADYAGWYEPDSPRIEILRFVEKLAGISRVHFNDGKVLYVEPWVGMKHFFPSRAWSSGTSPKRILRSPLLLLRCSLRTKMASLSRE